MDEVKQSVFRIGVVVSVQGRTITILVDKSKNASHLQFRGELIKNVSVGSYLKIKKGFIRIVCKVDEEYIEEDIAAGYRNERDRVKRFLKVSLLGFLEHNQFQRGIKEIPLIDNQCYLLDQDEFESVHRFYKQNDATITLGVLASEPMQEVKVAIDDLFASHIGIFGNTGSGKSYTLSKLYYELFSRYKDRPKFQSHARFVIIDFNGEYVSEDDNVIVGPQFKSVYRLSTSGEGDRYPLTYRTISDPMFWRVILHATEKVQTPFLNRALKDRWWKERVNTVEGALQQAKRLVLLAASKSDKELGKVFTDLIADISKCFTTTNVNDTINSIREKLQWHSAQGKYYYQVSPFNRLWDEQFIAALAADLDLLELGEESISTLMLLRLQIVFKYYDEIIAGHSNREHLSPLLKRLESRFDEIERVIRVDDETTGSKSLTIISLKEASIDLKKTLPLLICKDLYEEKKRKVEPNYLNLIIDEAHNILSTDSNRETEQWKDYRVETFEEIIKEGRKFGVFLTLASQRPSDISTTIVSQLHNYFLHRLINAADIRAIEKTVSYLDRTTFESIPILPTGTCIFAGITAHIPIAIEVGSIPAPSIPKNKTPGLVKHWT